MVALREPRVQEDVRKQVRWPSAPSETLSSNAQLSPRWPQLVQQPSFCTHLTLPKGSTGPGVRRPGLWGWLATPWQWALGMSPCLPGELSSLHCQIRGGTCWFPKVLSPCWGLEPGPKHHGRLRGHPDLVKPNSAFPEQCNLERVT